MVLPAGGDLRPVPGIIWGDVLNNWAFALLGNLIGATVFAAGAYWYLCVRPEPKPEEQGPRLGADRSLPVLERPAAWPSWTPSSTRPCAKASRAPPPSSAWPAWR
jgi:hypothetical protein